jgi:protein gp37
MRRGERVSDRTKIEWTSATWNPTTGCDRVSAGCDHCYALTLAKRLKAAGNPRYQADGDARRSGPGFGLTLHRDKIEQPLKWKQPRLVFVDSMSDLFHAKVPIEFIERVFEVMADASQHRFQILTKRPGRMASVLRRVRPNPIPNVWLGTSVETQDWAEVRLPKLLETPAAVRFLSCEPLLGPVNIKPWLPTGDPGDGETPHVNESRGIDWVIAGGESGPHFRAIDPEWARSLRDQCQSAAVPFFFKQWGGRTPKAGGRLLDGKAWDEMPGHTTAIPTAAGFSSSPLTPARQS